MDSFPKINSLFKELRGEFANLKRELENDVNYSVSHAEIITFVESAEDALKDVEEQLSNIENDVDALNQTIEQRNSEDIDDDDERMQRMFNPDNDDED